MDALGDKLHLNWVAALQDNILEDIWSINLSKEKQQAESAITSTSVNVSQNTIHRNDIY